MAQNKEHHHLQATTRHGLASLAISIFARGLGAPLAFAANILIARHMPPANYGLYLSLLSAALIGGALASGGGGRVFLRELGRHAESKWTSLLTTLVIWARKFTFARAVFVSTAIVTFSAFVAPSRSRLGVLAPLTIAVALASALMLYAIGTLVGMGRVPLAQVVENAIKNALLLGFAIFLPLLGTTSVTAYMFGQLIAISAATAIGALIIYMGMSRLPSRKAKGVHIDKQTERSWSRSANYFLAGTIGATLLARLDVVLVTNFSGPHSAGIFGAASRIAQLAAIFGSVYVVWLQPRFAKLQRESTFLYRPLLFKATLLATMAGISVLGVSVVFARDIIDLYGESYASAATPFIIMSAAFFLWTVSTPSIAYLSVTGGEDLLGRLVWIQLIASVVMTALLSTAYGATGASFAYLICGAGAAIAGIYFAYIRSGAINGNGGPCDHT